MILCDHWYFLQLATSGLSNNVVLKTDLKTKLLTVKGKKADVSSVSPSQSL